MTSYIRNLRSFIIIVLGFSLSLQATQTMVCRWHAAYFDAVFVENYGGSDREERYVNDVVAKTNAVIGLDSLLKSMKRAGKLEHFERWQIVDDYVGSYNYVGGRKVPGGLRIEGRKAWFCFTDSIAMSKALSKLWQIDNVKYDPNERTDMWLFSLHVGLAKDHGSARRLYHEFEYGRRPDSAFLWLQIGGGFSVSHHFYQHETDGFYHTYIGLYLTRQNVLKAQEVLDKRGLKTTITSQYLTPAIIKKYARH
jgi:hypothetical protein